MIDTSLLRTLFEDDSMINRYLTVFRQDVPISMSDLKSSVANEDWENASIIAHSLKSQLSYLREQSAAFIALQLEKICEADVAPDMGQVHNEIGELERELERIFADLDAYLVVS